MHKKLASDLTSLAHSILQMKNKDDVFALKEKAHEVYEKLALLAYVEEYINTTPNATTTKSELIAAISEVETAKIVTPIVENNEREEITPEDQITPTFVPLTNEDNTTTVIEAPVETENSIQIETPDFIEDIVEAEPEEIATTNIADESVAIIEMDAVIEEDTTSQIVENEITEQPFDELEDILFGEDSNKDEADVIEDLETTIIESKSIVEETIIPEDKTTIPTLEEELKDTLSVDILANLFEKATPKKTLNDQFQSTIQIDLNDRIAFVKHLFEGDQQDFNRVVSQLNTIKTEKEAKQFIFKMVKPDYDWTNKEAYETRLLEIIERRFA